MRPSPPSLGAAWLRPRQSRVGDKRQAGLLGKRGSSLVVTVRVLSAPCSQGHASTPGETPVWSAGKPATVICRMLGQGPGWADAPGRAEGAARTNASTTSPSLGAEIFQAAQVEREPGLCGDSPMPLSPRGAPASIVAGLRLQKRLWGALEPTFCTGGAHGPQRIRRPAATGVPDGLRKRRWGTSCRRDLWASGKDATQ